MQGGTAGAQGCAWGSAARRRAPLPPPPPPHGCSLRAHRLLLPCTLVLLLQLLHHLVTPAATLPAPHEAAWGCSRLHTPLGLVPLHWISPCALPPPPATPLLGRGGSEQAAQQAQGGSEVGPQPVGGLAFSPARRPAATHAASNDGAGCRWLAGEGCGEAACWEQQRAVARWERRLRARLHAAAALQPRAGRAAGPSVESIMQWHS